MKNLRVIYESQEVEKEFDDAIEEFLETLGFKRWASGYNLEDQERDLAFDKVDS